MWETSKFMVRKHMRLRQIERLQRKMRMAQLAILGLKRVDGEVRIVGDYKHIEGPIPARVLLNDFTPGGLRFFSTAKLISGQRISITLDGPRWFYVLGRVKFCNPASLTSRVLSETKFQWRVGIQFVVESHEEERQIREYYQEMLREHGTYPSASSLAQDPKFNL